MAPFPHKSEDGGDEILEAQNTAHYNPHAVHGLQPVSLLESINSVLHVTKSSDNNGSQPGSSSGFQSPPSTSGQGDQEEESDLVVLLSLFVPLAATVTAIFIIALFVRRMRRAGSAQEVQRRANSNNLSESKNEFQMMPRKTVSTGSTTSGVSSASSSSSHSSASSSSSSSSSSNSSLQRSNNNNPHRSVASSRSANSQSYYYGSSINSFSSSGGGSLYRNLSYLHLPLQHQNSLPSSLSLAGGVSTTPTGVPPPWPLAAESGLYYTRSHYGLNKLQQQLYQQASLQAYASVQNLNGLILTRQYSDPQSCSSQSDPEIDNISSGGEENNSNSSNNNNNDNNSSSRGTKEKSSHKKIKRVLSAMNFPRRIRQYQADRKRFNIYTIPTETREQLKHIYVY